MYQVLSFSGCMHHVQVVILYVDEEESVRRQMRRAQLAAMHNKRVMDAGTGDVWDVRTTDVNEALCRRRYQVGGKAEGKQGLVGGVCRSKGLLEGARRPPRPGDRTTLRWPPFRDEPWLADRRCIPPPPPAAGVQSPLPHHPAPQVLLPLLPH